MFARGQPAEIPMGSEWAKSLIPLAGNFEPVPG
jgi:hypothetical protein